MEILFIMTHALTYKATVGKVDQGYLIVSHFLVGVVDLAQRPSEWIV